MNYEVKLFHDYESITIDNLKDKPNSLLNLVAEEQRPLCVSMENGKELLIFPQDILAPLCDHDFCLILIAAMRYAMGRNTYMPMVVADYIKRHIQLLDDKFLVLAADDIRTTLRTTEDTSQIPISGRDFWMRSKHSVEKESLVQQRKSGHALHAGNRWKS